MKRSLLVHLRCPCCRSALVLHPIVERDGEIVETGVLSCASKCSWYPIINFVPVLLDFRIPLHEEFIVRHGGAKGTDLPLPSGAPRKGELDIQQSFTVEWSGLGQDKFTFVFSVEQREQHIRAELDWPDELLSRAANESFIVLDIGAGFGLEPIYINKATGAEVVGIDLNLSLLESGATVAKMPKVHTIVASLFALPFAERSFDLVYSNGVIHHTYSTEAAFACIERARKTDGAIYTWVYASDDFFLLTWKGKVQYVLEAMFRPTFSRLPAKIQNVFLYPLAYRNMLVGRRALNRGEEWTLKNALHQTRDIWTPRYAHRHRFNEVLRWYSELGLEARPIDPVAVQKHLPIPVMGIGVRGASRQLRSV